MGCRGTPHARYGGPRRPRVVAAKAGFALPAGKSFIIVKEDKIGKAHRFSGEKLSPVLAIFKYSGFDNAL